MSDAKRILDERLAKGEINLEEYDRLVERLKPGTISETDPRTDPQPAPQEPLQQPKKKSNFWVNLGGGAVALFLIIAFMVAAPLAVWMSGMSTHVVKGFP